MRLEKSGKLIKKIKIGKNMITIVFADQELKISPDTYTEFRLYQNKVLTDQEVEKIKSREQIDKLLKSALVSVSKGHPTKKVMISKLEKKGANRFQIDKIIEILVESGFLDDKQFMNDYLEYAKNKGYGKERIIQGLYDKGVPQHMIKDIKFEQNDEFKRARMMLKTYEKKFSRYNYIQRKKHIYDALLRMGYESAIAFKVLDNIKKESDNDEEEHLKKDYQIAQRKYQNKGRKKVLEYLLSKGYRYTQIVKVMTEEKTHEMD